MSPFLKWQDRDHVQFLDPLVNSFAPDGQAISGWVWASEAAQVAVKHNSQFCDWVMHWDPLHEECILTNDLRYSSWCSSRWTWHRWCASFEGAGRSTNQGPLPPGRWFEGWITCFCTLASRTWKPVRVCVCVCVRVCVSALVWGQLVSCTLKVYVFNSTCHLYPLLRMEAWVSVYLRAACAPNSSGLRHAATSKHWIEHDLMLKAPYSVQIVIKVI